ncbi:MAG: RidA family protein [Streptosporangiaceae bacterium]
MVVSRVETPWVGGSYSDSVTIPGPGGRLIFVSGQIGASLDGKLVEGGPQAEADQMFERVRISLEKAGAALEHVVKITGWVVDFDHNFRYYSDARARAFAGHLPASAAVETTRLSFGALFEVEAIAFVPDE